MAHTQNESGEGKTPGGVDRPGWIDLAFNFDVILYNSIAFRKMYINTEATFPHKEGICYMNPLEGFPLFSSFLGVICSVHFDALSWKHYAGNTRDVCIRLLPM